MTEWRIVSEAKSHFFVVGLNLDSKWKGKLWQKGGGSSWFMEGHVWAQGIQVLAEEDISWNTVTKKRCKWGISKDSFVPRWENDLSSQSTCSVIGKYNWLHSQLPANKRSQEFTYWDAWYFADNKKELLFLVKLCLENDT